MSKNYQSTRAFSAKSEKKAAQLFKGRVQIGSGAFKIAKGDVLTDRFLIEDKITDKSSFSVNKAIWEGIRRNALKHRRQPMIRVTVEGKHTFCILEQDELLHLLSQVKE